ncbi:MAG TPA: glycosyltransferase [Gaiellaceae bacterium]|nr:glycosyltransferase [Gaiellaceae bacterium]
MRVVLFVHSLASDWNHGNAHFLRGVVAELGARGHDVRVFEPHDAWSREQLVRDHGEEPLRRFAERFPHLASARYTLEQLDLDEALDGADLVLVHEWNDPELVRRVGERRAGGSFRLLFHDTHHRAVTRPEEMDRYDLRHYDGVLAFGRVLRDLYLERGWAARAWVWHEAADTRIFRPQQADGTRCDLVWIGNWGDGERTRELEEFLLGPARTLGLSGSVHGVRYPEEARHALARSGLDYRGWLPNADAPRVFARHRVTVHVPRRPYVEALPGIPTIRPFEALACGIPLVSAPWDDVEGLFRAGEDHLVAADGAEMCRALEAVLHDAELAASLRREGLRTITERHTCAHRVDELLAIARELRPETVAA